MSAFDSIDSFVVVNGPEDGMEFPVVRSPFNIGRDASCTVNVRLDTAVRNIHAHVAVVSDGYRIRRADAAPVYVNGHRTGMVRSRVARSGDLVQIGQTVLSLDCRPEGLASRSHGIVAENDVVWAVHKGSLALYGLVLGLLQFLRAIFGRLVGSWLGIGAVVVILYLAWPWFHDWATYVFLRVYYMIVYFIAYLYYKAMSSVIR